MAVFCSKCGEENENTDNICKKCGDPMAFQRGPIPEGVILEGRYEILNLLKTGGMGAVYKAKDTKLNSICAVKELLSPYGETEKQKKAEEWFLREAEILAGLDHANLPKVFDYFASHNRYYLVMNFIEGEDLERVLKKEGSPGLPEEKVAEWARQVLEVLVYLHNQSPPIVYRDIKPSNLMLHKDGRIILIDFGIARAIQKDSDTQKTAIGTLGYVPEEQCQGQPEPRSDLYALGATMHHLLTGAERVPFKFEAPRKINPQISADLEKVVMKAVKHKPSERFESASHMLEVLTYTKKLKPPPGIIKKTFKKITSKPFLPFVSAFFILLFLGAIAGGYSISRMSRSDWKPQNSGVKGRLKGICFIDSLTGWASGEKGIIIHTSDGGTTWEEQKTGIDVDLESIYFADKLHGMAIGKKWQAGQCMGVTLNTEDGGKTWKKEYIEIPKDFISVFILDLKNAWAVGNMGTLYHITDEGRVWNKIDAGIGENIYEVRFVDSSEGWIRTEEKIGDMESKAILLHTADGGKTWEKQDMGFINSIITFDFADPCNGWSTGMEEKEDYKFSALIKHTSDGGKTWENQEQVNSIVFYSIYFLDEKNGWVLGSRLKGLFGLGGTILYTSDGGKTWKEENFPYLSCTRFCFIDPENGWAVGCDGAILKYSPKN